jgi:hypothetical protein
MTRRRYAEPLAVWAELHAETPEPPAAPDPDLCAHHGPYTPTPSGDCTCCLAAMDDADEHDRRTAWQRASDHADRRDAAGDALDNTFHY